MSFPTCHSKEFEELKNLFKIQILKFLSIRNFVRLLGLN